MYSFYKPDIDKEHTLQTEITVSSKELTQWQHFFARFDE